MKHSNVLKSDSVADEVQVNIDVFDSLMLNRVHGYVGHHIYIVGEHDSSLT